LAVFKLNICCASFFSIALKPDNALKNSSKKIKDREGNEGSESGGESSTSSPASSPRNHRRSALDGVQDSPLRDIGNDRTMEDLEAPLNSLPSPPMSLEVPFVDYRGPSERIEEAGMSTAEVRETTEDRQDDLDRSRASELESPPSLSLQHGMVRPAQYRMLRASPADVAQAQISSGSSNKKSRSTTYSSSLHPEPAAFQALREAHDAMLRELADTTLSADQLVTAQEMLHEMSGMLNEKWRNILMSRAA